MGTTVAAEVILTRPPNYDQIVAAFPAVKLIPGVIYSWGKSIYNPDNTDLTAWLRAHENVHGQEQLKMGIEEWWDQYIKSVDFRFGQEVPAHHAEYKTYCSLVKSARDREGMLQMIAQRLAGSLYGEMVSFVEARRLTRGGKT